MYRTKQATHESRPDLSSFRTRRYFFSCSNHATGITPLLSSDERVWKEIEHSMTYSCSQISSGNVIIGDVINSGIVSRNKTQVMLDSGSEMKQFQLFPQKLASRYYVFVKMKFFCCVRPSSTRCTGKCLSFSSKTDTFIYPEELIVFIV